MTGQRDEPHAEPERQITRQVKLPAAGQERQIKADDPAKAGSRPHPDPAWPAAENGTNQADGAAKQPGRQESGTGQHSDSADGGARHEGTQPTSPESTSRQEDSRPGEVWPPAKPRGSARQEPGDARQSADREEGGQQKAPRRDPIRQPEGPGRQESGAAARPEIGDSQRDPIRQPGSLGRQEPGAAARPENGTRQQGSRPGAAWQPADSGRQEPGPARQPADRDNNGRQESSQPSPARRPESPGRQEPGAPARPEYGTRQEGSRPGTVWPEHGARQEDPRPGAPGQGPFTSGDQNSGRAPQTRDNAPTSFIRPRNDDAPPSFTKPGHGAAFRRPGGPDNAATTFIRRDDPPGRTRNTDSATVDLTRPEPDRGTGWPPPEPPRATPERIGGQPEPAEPEAEKRPRKPLLIAAIAVVAVIALAAGVVFGVPGLSDRLGLTGEDPVAIDPPPAPVSYSPALQGPDTAAPGPTRQGVEQALSGPMADPALGNVNGIVIDPTTGETLYEKNPDAAITPASTGKILTAAAALLSLDPTEQLVTQVVEGEQPGEVIIVGGGDPTISSLEVGKESIYPGAAHLSELVDQVKAGGTRVQTVYIDQSRYAPPGLAPSWLPGDVGAGYITPIVPAMLDGDRQGDATENYSPRTTDPGRTLVEAFADRIGASPADSIEKKAPADAKVLGEIRSAPVTQLVDNMLNRSENTLADTLAHEVAIRAGEEPSFDGASKAMLDVLRQNGFDVEGTVLRDGSGMSEENKMTARLLGEVLAVAAGPDGKDPRTAKLRPLLGGLPVAGGSGTLADRYTEADAVAGKGWVRAKTGSLTGINSLAGIVLDEDDRPLVFAFLTSGTVATSARPALDGVTAVLRGCGCR